MATLKNKVYIQNSDGSTSLVDLTNGLRVSSIVNTLGDKTANVIDVVDYDDDISAQSLLALTADLLANDIAINNEKNAVNDLFCEGVIHKQGTQFEYTVTEAVDSYIIKLNNGLYNAHYTDSDGSIVKKIAVLNTAEVNRTFTISKINYKTYRRDLLSLVIVDDNVSDSALPYLKITEENESTSRTAAHNKTSRINTDSFVSIPLYDIESIVDGSKTKNSGVTQIFSFCGMASVFQLKNARMYNDQTKDATTGIIRGNKNLFKLYAGTAQEFCDSTGTALIPNYGQAYFEPVDASYLSTVTPKPGCYPSYKEEIAFQIVKSALDDLSESSRFNLPFMISNKDNDYLTNVLDIVVKKIYLYAQYENESAVSKEGIEAIVYEAARYAYYPSTTEVQTEFAISTYSRVNGYDFITLNDDHNIEVAITNTKAVTYDANTYTVSSSPAVGDVILITQGKGLYQTAPIVSIDNNTIKVAQLPIQLDLTSGTTKLIIFKDGTERPVNNDVIVATSSISGDIIGATALAPIMSGGEQAHIVELPYTITLQFGSWYFLKIHMKPKSNPNSITGELPKIAVLNKTVNTLTQLNGLYYIDYAPTFGLYKAGNTVFSFYDQFGDIFTTSANRALYNPDRLATPPRPARYKPVAVNFLDENFARTFETESGYVYIDVLTGRIKFHDGEAPVGAGVDYFQVNGYITSVVYGALNTQQMLYTDDNQQLPLASVLYALMGGTLSYQNIELSGYITAAQGLSITDPTDATGVDDVNASIVTLGGMAVKKNAFFGGNGYFGGNLTVEGNFTVNGTTTTINAANMALEDNIIELNKGETSNVVSLGSAGITINRGTGLSFNILFKEDAVTNGSQIYVGLAGSEKQLAYNEDVQTCLSILQNGVVEKSKNDTTAEHIVLFNDATGKAVKDSGVTISTTNEFATEVTHNAFVPTKKAVYDFVTQYVLDHTSPYTVTNTTNATAGNIPEFVDATGKVIQDSGMSLKAATIKFGPQALPIGILYTSIASAPDPELLASLDVNGRFMSGKIYNAIYNDIAEAVPSDGTLVAGDIAMVDLHSSTYRVTKYDGVHNDAIVGIVAGDPGFIVGYNSEYENQIFIALKGMVWCNIEQGTVYQIGSKVGMHNGKIIAKQSIKDLEVLRDFYELGTIITIDASLSKIKIFV